MSKSVLHGGFLAGEESLTDLFGRDQSFLSQCALSFLFIYFHNPGKLLNLNISEGPGYLLYDALKDTVRQT